MKWNILNILKNEIYLELSKKFINNLKCRFRDKSINQSNLAKRLGVNRATVSMWFRNVNKIPYSVLVEFSKILSIDQRLFLQNVKGIALRKGRVRIKEPYIDIVFNNSFSRFLGHIYGDGCIRSNLTISYTNLEKSLIDDFVISAIKTFGKIDYYTYKSKDGTLNVGLPKVIGMFLVKCFQGIQKKKVPLKQLLLDKSLISEFVGALFDDEGTVSVKKRGLLIRFSHYHSLKDLKVLLITLGIDSSDIQKQSKPGYVWYSLGIYRRKNIQKFQSIITLKHKRKKYLIKELLSSYSRKYVDYELREAILSKLKERSMTSSDLVNLLESSLTSICKCLANLQRNGFLNKKKIYRTNKLGNKYPVNFWSIR